jgi:phosphotriesterase-related protein
LTIASHTGDGPAALEQLEIIDSERISPKRLVWVHAQNELDHSIRLRFAQLGGWVELDGLQPRSADWHLQCLEKLRDKKLLSRVLISQDSGWYHVGEPHGGEYRGYDFVYRSFLPSLAAKDQSLLMVTNPRKAFGV